MSSNANNRMENYEIIRKQDEGQFGIIYLAKKKDDQDKLVALKQIPLSKLQGREKLFQMINNEIQVLKSISHRNIIKLLDQFEQQHEIILIYEYCEGMNAHHFIKTNGNQTEKQALSWVYQMVQGLNVLDQYNVVHRDLKLENVLVHTDPKTGEQILKLADFGLCSVNPEQREKASIGSPAFIAPECLSMGMYTCASDIYALGVLLYEIFTGKLPWKLTRYDNLLMKKTNFAPDKEAFRNYSKNAYNLTAGMMHWDIEQRINLTDLNVVQANSVKYFHQKEKRAAKITPQITVKTPQGVNQVAYLPSGKPPSDPKLVKNAKPAVYINRVSDNVSRGHSRNVSHDIAIKANVLMNPNEYNMNSRNDANFTTENLRRHAAINYANPNLIHDEYHQVPEQNNNINSAKSINVARRDQRNPMERGQSVDYINRGGIKAVQYTNINNPIKESQDSNGINGSVRNHANSQYGSTRLVENVTDVKNNQRQNSPQRVVTQKAKSFQASERNLEYGLKMNQFQYQNNGNTQENVVSTQNIGPRLIKRASYTEGSNLRINNNLAQNPLLQERNSNRPPMIEVDNQKNIVEVSSNTMSNSNTMSITTPKYINMPTQSINSKTQPSAHMNYDVNKDRANSPRVVSNYDEKSNPKSGNEYAHSNYGKTLTNNTAQMVRTKRASETYPVNNAFHSNKGPVKHQSLKENSRPEFLQKLTANFTSEMNTPANKNNSQKRIQHTTSNFSSSNMHINNASPTNHGPKLSIANSYLNQRSSSPIQIQQKKIVNHNSGSNFQVPPQLGMQMTNNQNPYRYE